jgi:hypothetical protein
MISVFSKEWFKKYNRIITKVARLPLIGEWIFHFKKFGHYVDRKRIVEVTPNSVIEFVKMRGKKKVELRQHFFVRNEYALRLQKVFYPIWITFHIWDIITRPFPQLNLGFDTLTVNPDAGSGATTVDGVIIRSADESFSSIRSGDGTGAYPLPPEPSCGALWGSATGNQYTMLSRAIFTFSTSTIGSDATISSATLSLNANYKANALGSDTYHICASTPANNNNLEVGDYKQLGSTSFGNIAYASISITGYNDWSLNSSGISNISKTGISRFGLRSGWDINNSTTGLTWSSGVSSQIAVYHSDNGSNKPKLVVTYTTSTAYTTEITEALAMVSSDTQAQALLSTIINNLVLSETQTDNSQFNQSATDNLVLSEQDTESINRGAIINDNLSLEESETNLSTFNQTMSESLANSEETVGSISFSSTIQETINGSESLGIITKFVNSISDSLAIVQELWGDWWEELSKHSTSWTQSSKNTTSWTQSSKNTTSWTQETKNKTNTKLG